MSMLPMKKPGRSSEPSTWAGVAALIIGAWLSSQGYEQESVAEITAGVGAIISGVFAIVRRERGNDA